MLSFSTARVETSEERPAAMFCEALVWIFSLREMMDRGCSCKDLISKRASVYFEVAMGELFLIVYLIVYDRS